MLCWCLLTSCQCEKYSMSTVPVLFICSRYLSLQVTVSVTVFVLCQNFSLLVAFPRFKLQTLYETIQWPPSPRKTYFLVTNWYQLGDTWNFLLIHREILYYVSDSTYIEFLHKPSLLSAIPLHKVNIHKATKFAQTHQMYTYIQNKHSNTVHYGLFDCLCNTEISKSHFTCSSSQCIWDCCFSLACCN